MRRLGVGVLLLGGVSLLAGCSTPETRVVAVDDCPGLVYVLVVDTLHQRAHSLMDFAMLSPGMQEQFSVPVGMEDEVAVMVRRLGEGQLVTTIVPLSEGTLIGEDPDGVTRVQLTITGAMCSAAE